MRSKRVATLVIGIVILVLIAVGCTSDNGVDDSVTGTAEPTDAAPRGDPCKDVVQQAVDLTAELAGYMDGMSPSDLQDSHADDTLADISRSIEALHSRFGSSCAEAEYQIMFRRAVSEVEASSESGRFLLDQFRGDNPLR